jgi:methionyl-tRNA synthetase
MGASLLAPFLPETGDRIASQLNTSLREFDTLHEFGLYPSGNKVTDAPEILFARLDKEETLAKAEAIQARQREEFLAHQKKARENLVKAGRMTAEEAKALEQAENPAAAGEEEGIDIEAKPEITFDDFEKLQFQVGEIIACEAVEKSKKLLCSQVRIGSQVKQIVSGIRKYYSPEEMVGKKVMVLVNLKPAKLAGVLSEGMLLCAEDAEGNLALLTPEKNMPSGAEIA